MVILKNYLRQNLIQISTKNAPNDTIFSKFSWGSMPPNPALSAVVLSLYRKTPPYDTPFHIANVQLQSYLFYILLKLIIY